jgi:hypothetical protein
MMGIKQNFFELFISIARASNRSSPTEDIIIVNRQSQIPITDPIGLLIIEQEFEMEESSQLALRLDRKQMSTMTDMSNFEAREIDGRHSHSHSRSRLRE